jgi:glycosyltransferase involved in cell wall biosynthesis
VEFEQAIESPSATPPARGSRIDSKPSVAVAIPAYNEAEGIAEFVREIDGAVAPHTSALHIVVVDDASTDNSVELLDGLRPQLAGTLEVVSNAVNRGHGPSVLEAYRRALQADPDYVLQVDGDGQFLGSDLRRLLVLLIDDAHAVSGVRRFRQDPWFRMVMTRLLRGYVHMSFGVSARDPNCPLRGYEAPLLAELLTALPEECLIPNLYLTVVAARRGLALLEVDVSHRVRRGSSLVGSTWARGVPSPIPLRLVHFSLAALRESRSFRAQVGRAH